MAREFMLAAVAAVSVVGDFVDETKPVRHLNLLQVSRSGSPGPFHFQTQKQPLAQGHFLTNSELSPITAISCLKAKQANPAVICENTTVNTPEGGYAGLVKDINAGNYPNYEDGVCNSKGEYFCDPNGALSPEQGLALGAQLKTLRESNVVTCGGQLNDKVDPLHYQPFNLGVVIANEWPTAQSDPESLQNLGQFVAAQWHMDKRYEGSAVPYARCPNTAVLVILPDRNQAHLSSASCEFICATRGGPEVVTATLVALEKYGAAAAAAAGIETAYKAISTIPGRSTIPVTSVRGNAEAQNQVLNDRRLPLYNLIQRVLFGIAFVLLIVSLALGITVLCISPGVLAKSRKR